MQPTSRRNFMKTAAATTAMASLASTGRAAPSERVRHAVIGTVEISRKGCHITPIGEERTLLSGLIERADNMRNFVDCVKADDPTDLTAPISEGAPSSMLCHLGNIGTRLGRRLQFDPASYQFMDDDEANALASRDYRAGYELPEAFRA